MTLKDRNKLIDQIILALTKWLCYEMGIEKIPYRYKTKTEFYKYHNKNKNHKTEGAASCEDCYCFYVDRNTCIAHLAEAVSHELTHFKYPDLKHGKEFDKIVGSYLVCK